VMWGNTRLLWMRFENKLAGGVTSVTVQLYLSALKMPL
jgi:hypothetical protein